MARFILVVILILVVLGGLAAAVNSITSSPEAIANSMAEIEQYRAMQAQAAATREAVSALGTYALIDQLKDLALLVMVLVVLGLVGYLVYQTMKLRQMQLALLLAEENKPKGAWAPGPNAGWKKLGDAAQAPALPQPTFQEVMSVAMMTMMMRLMGQENQQQYPALPANRQVINARPTGDEVYEEIGTTRPVSAWEEMFQ